VAGETMSDSTTIKWAREQDGVVVLTLDDPKQRANTMNADYIASMGATVERLQAEKDEIAGVVVTSAKRTFFAGGDLHDLLAVKADEAAEFAEFVRGAKAQLRRLETLGVPVVAAIAGSALGGGLEIALATHRRIVVDDSAIALGLPEVTLGLLPGGGGVTRTVRMLGVVQALTRLLLEGKPLRPRQALELGLVDELVADGDELLAAAKAWIAANPQAAQPWDVKGHRIPGGSPSDRQLAQILPTLPSNLRKSLKGASYPAPLNIMAAAVEGAQVDFDSAIEIEGRYMVDLATGQVAKNMIQAFFFDMQRVNGARDRPDGIDRFRARKLVVLGAGMMGAAIAYVCAKAGIEVVLKDVTLEAAERGKQYSARVLEREVARKRRTQADAEAILARILATDDPAAADGADTVIEAVFEDPDLKRRVFAEILPHLAGDALLASNTSTLPITGLAEGVPRPADFIGLHFFSPVDRMPLLEIVLGRETSDTALYRSLDLAKQIAKTPIVVKDSRGFFTSRLITSFMNEALATLLEGVAPASIEQASLQAGYPAPVLQLSDEVNLTLMRDIGELNKHALQSAGGSWSEHPAYRVLGRMIDDHGRPGKLGGAGFYDYVDGRRSGLWKGLTEAFPSVSEPSTVDLNELIERMLVVEAIEAVKCVDEGVIESVADANVGSLLGIGFPGWTGGVLQYINGYIGRDRPDRRGPAGFVERARELSDKHGERFDPPASLVRRAQRGELYSDENGSASAASTSEHTARGARC
jgi:3-hydroxyacyl-CoA dehydrogenase / enoyl-CoA hydratase / 3-hydroxybutyryl-CoA epimerase